MISDSSRNFCCTGDPTLVITETVTPTYVFNLTITSEITISCSPTPNARLLISRNAPEVALKPLSLEDEIILIGNDKQPAKVIRRSEEKRVQKLIPRATTKKKTCGVPCWSFVGCTRTATRTKGVTMTKSTIVVKTTTTKTSVVSTATTTVTVGLIRH